MDRLESIQQVRAWRETGDVGLVATMGALHEGHASLIRQSVAGNARTLVCIFVNPAQFAPGEDLDKYPRSLEADVKLCAECGADAVFTPDDAQMYPQTFGTWVNVEGLSDRLCGATRPSHFKGVTTIVSKLLNIVHPTRAYFGQKDAQQVLILKRMVSDLNVTVELIVCPIIREPDGLAMSSRNRYLSENERQRAVGINKALRKVEELFKNGTRTASILHAQLLTTLDDHVDKIEYAEIVSTEDLEPVTEITKTALVAVAALVGSTRLIDNTILEL